MCRSSPSSTTWQFVSESEQDTNRLGAALGQVIQPGAVIALIGELGSGKTRFVQAVAEALGAERKTVTSPTFVLIQEYEARLPVYHVDTYRLRDTDEFLELGVAELLESDGVCLIEWADRVAEVLPEDILRVKVDIAGPSCRLFALESTGPKSNELLYSVRKAVESP